MPEDQALGKPAHRYEAEEKKSEKDTEKECSVMWEENQESCDTKEAKRNIFKKEESVNYVKCL